VRAARQNDNVVLKIMVERCGVRWKDLIDDGGRSDSISPYILSLTKKSLPLALLALVESCAHRVCAIHWHVVVVHWRRCH
jgi:hypothetical protein